jgi:aminoglycoside phosphotransferase (APT) family kinase protein
MSTSKMHAGEADIDVALVGQLIAEQFPRWAGLPISAVGSMGTVNAIYRVGDHLCARLPRVEEWARDLEREWRWLPRLAPGLSLTIPEPVGKGHATDSYPFSWAIYGWIEGRPYADDLVDDELRAARDLAGFVDELRRMDPARGAPRGGRGPLHELDAPTREALWSAGGVIDGDASIAAWERALEAPAWRGTPVWVHADLLRPNVLVRGGQLCGVIDFGGVGVGDPAADVIAAWTVFGSAGRRAFREALGVDDGTWNRARGLALHQAALIIPYYGETNPGFVSLARRTVEEILVDVGA